MHGAVEGLGGAISDSGGLVKIDGNTVTLAGTNTWTEFYWRSRKPVFDNIAANQDFSLFSGLVVDNQQVMTTSVFVMITGVLIGALGSAFAVSRFLDV